MGAPRKRRRGRGEPAAAPPRSGLAGDIRAADAPAAEATPAAAPRRARPDVDARHGPDAGLSRSEARNAAIRESLEPLAPGERPGALVAAVVVAVAVAVVNVALLVGGYELTGAVPSTVVTAVILLVAAGGMWTRRYWAVLLFQVVLGITCVYAGLSLLVASNAGAAGLSMAIVALTGVLFYKLVRVMARMQVPTS